MQPMIRLLEIMRALRDRETGCPWDIEQNFQSIAPYTVEEAYEVADAIERDDMQDLKDELGDLLFQVVYHAQMANEVGAFDFADVVASINDKLVRRHPHVFGDIQVKDKVELEQQWQQHKQQEREHKQPAGGAIHGIAANLPALDWSSKIQKRAARTGFNWPGVEPVFEKLEEEIDELKAEISQPDNHDRILDEFGDVMFVCVNLAMHLEVNAETALRHANRKFIGRFQTMEQLISQGGTSFDQLSLQQMEAYWQESKKLLSTDERR